MQSPRVCPRCSTETAEVVCPDDGVATIPVQSPTNVTYAAGTVIAERYRTDQVLGIGGFGAVYKCTQLNMNQTVAVKVLRSEHLSSVEHVKRFTREAQAASRLKHPNTIHIFDFGVHSDGALYLAMEFVEGETLGHRIDQHGVVHWEALVHIVGQVCHSLTEAHSAGLVHRDLKPENIMLLPVAGDPNFVKVLDFGIAKVQKDTGGPSEQSLTEAGMIMGTPSYMSPEQAKGERIDPRSDIYSLGVMMYEALTGKPPFVGESAMTVLVAHIKDPPRPMPRDGSLQHVPREIEAVVFACLEKEPERRPQTTIQLVDRLQTAAKLAREAGQVTEVRSAVAGPTQLVPSADWARERIPLGSDSGDRAVRERGEPPPPVMQVPAPSRAPVWLGVGAVAVIGGVAAAVIALFEQSAPPPVQAGSAAGPSPAAAAVAPPGATGVAGSALPAQPAAAASAAASDLPTPALPAAPHPDLRDAPGTPHPGASKPPAASPGSPRSTQPGPGHESAPGPIKPDFRAPAVDVAPASVKPGSDVRPVAAPERPDSRAEPAAGAKHDVRTPKPDDFRLD
ncbi:MAG: serine/threonine protein kinase [Myxococcales bacterium]|nr:serine/threonine protein kinase [Myxococcales bacterium]